MNNNEKVFFNQAKDHSKIKLIILEKFFQSWVNKVFYNHYNKNNNELMVFDGFAGPGEYDSGEKGSPLICLENTFKLINHGDRINDKNNKKMKIYLLFCEKDPNNYNKLCNKIKKRGLFLKKDLPKVKKYSNLKGNITVGITNNDFSDCFNNFTKRRNEKYKYNPCFSFIDPFGYKDIKFSDIVNFLNVGKTDIILNMIYEHFNRFLGVENQSLNETHKQFLGASNEEFTILQNRISHVKSFERVEIVTEFYKKKLEEKKFFVSKIKIKNGQKVKMVLFYISKNVVGFNLFKEIRHYIENSLQDNQLQLTDMNNKALLTKKIKKFLKENFSPKFEYNKVLEIIKKHETFPESIFKKTIQNMRKNEEITIFKNNKITKRDLNNTEIIFSERTKNE